MTASLIEHGDLAAVLMAQGVPHVHNAQARTIELPARSPPLDSLCYLRWDKELPFLQVICPLLLAVPADRHRDLETAICRANNAIPFPGFGLDHERGTLYFRHTLLVIPELTAAVIQRVVLAVTTSARDFVVPFRDIVDGKPGAELMQAAVAYAQALHAAVTGSAFKD